MVEPPKNLPIGGAEDRIYAKDLPDSAPSSADIKKPGKELDLHQRRFSSSSAPKESRPREIARGLNGSQDKNLAPQEPSDPSGLKRDGIFETPASTTPWEVAYIILLVGALLACGIFAFLYFRSEAQLETEIQKVYQLEKQIESSRD